MAEKAAQYRALALTDHGTIAGALRFQRACERTGATPVFGVELYVGFRDDESRNYHLTVLAKSRKGFASICKVLSKGHDSSLSRGHSLVPWEEVLMLEDVVILSGCASSPVHKKPHGPALGIELAGVFGKDFYAEVQPLDDFEEQYKVNRDAIALAKLTLARAVVTQDCHFAEKDERELHEFILAVGSKDVWSRPDRWRFTTGLNYFMGAEEVKARLIKTGLGSVDAELAIKNTLEVAEKCAGWRFEKMPVELPGAQDADARLIEAAQDGLRLRGKDGESVYMDRMATELEAFIPAGLSPYLLLVSEIVGWAKSSGILTGPGRGSAAGSVIVWALGITEIDPIRHGLSYERFFAPGREAGYPDIDVDFAARDRGLVERHLKERFGADRVARVSTYTTVGARQAIRDAGRVMEVPTRDLDEISKLVMQRIEGEQMGLEGVLFETDAGRRFCDRWPKAAAFALGYEGRVRQASVHAGGFVIGSEPLTDGTRGVVARREGERVVTWDKDDLEFFGLLKIDLLGLSTLDVLDETARIITAGQPQKQKWWEIDLEDPKLYEAVREGHTTGVFQFQTYGLRTFARKMKVSKFEHLVLATAAFRPGGIGQGILDQVAEVVGGEEEPPILHPKVEALLNHSYGFLVFQDDLMKLCVVLAGWTWAEADALRRVVSKSKGEEAFKEFRESFVGGCVRQRSMGREDAEALFDSLVSFGRYGFVRCLAENTPVMTLRGPKLIGRVREGDQVFSSKGLRKVIRSSMMVRDGWRIRTEDGREAIASEDHRFFSPDGAGIRVESLRVGSEIAVVEIPDLRSRRMHPRRALCGSTLLEASSAATKVWAMFSRRCRTKDGRLEQGPDKGTGQAHSADGRRSHGAEKLDVQGRSDRANPYSSEIQVLRALRFGAYPLPCASQEQEPGRQPPGESCSIVSELPFDRALSGTRSEWERRCRREGSAARVECWVDEADEPRSYENFRLAEREEAGGRDPSLASARIASIERVGPVRMYDLGVEHPHNFFLANGILSHNSHAVSYSAISAATLWASVYVPDAYLTALLNYGALGGATDLERRDKVLDEAERLGIEVLPPDVNYSLETARLETVNKIRLGLSEIDRVGPKAIEALIEARGSKGFGTFDEVLMRVPRRKCNVGVMERLADAGAFASVGIEGGGLTGSPKAGSLRAVAPRVLSDVKKGALACNRCELRKGCKRPVPPTPGKLNLLVVGEAPGREEEHEGKGFVGPSGRLLRETLEKFGLDSDSPGYANSIACRPKDQFPSVEFIDVCPWVDETIKALRPAAILALGNKALYKFTQRQSGIMGMIGSKMLHGSGAHIVFGLHPATVLYRPELSEEFESGVRKFVKLVERLA